MSDREVNQKDVVIWSDGSRLRGSVFSPAKREPEGTLPGILMLHGWGGTRDHLNKAYAPLFARSGFLVLTFDYRSWADSDGFVQADDFATSFREVINPSKMLEDARAALAYLVGEPGVQADNLGVWGTSLGGGFAVVLAASDSRVKAVVTQIGALDSKSNFDGIPEQQVLQAETQRARGEISAFPGPESSVQNLTGCPDFIALKKYDPAAYWSQLRVPTLVIDAEDEELFDRMKNGAALCESLKGRVPAEYLVLPGRHYDIYESREQYRAALQAAQDWFVTHLHD